MLKFKINIKEKQIINNEQFKKDWIKYVPKLKDGDYLIEIKKWHKDRSLNQNKFYWGVIIPILSNYFETTKEEIHSELKYKFLRTTFIGIDGGEIIHIPSTSDLKTIEFEEYLQRIRQWFSEEYGEYLPLPNELYDEMIY